MCGRTLTECKKLLAEASEDDRLADELAERQPSYSEYLRRRAAWKRQLGNGSWIESTSENSP
jgi:hypothetical protein